MKAINQKSELSIMNNLKIGNSRHLNINALLKEHFIETHIKEIELDKEESTNKNNYKNAISKK